jgi:hypothetical protein
MTVRGMGVWANSLVTVHTARLSECPTLARPLAKLG